MDDQNQTPRTGSIDPISAPQPQVTPPVSPVQPTPDVAPTVAPPPPPPLPNPAPASTQPAAQTLQTEDATESDATDVSPSALQTVAHGFGAGAAVLFSWVVFPVAVVLILHYFVFQAYHVLGTSMVSTLHESDYLIISKVGYTTAMIERVFGKDHLYIPGRGEIIVFHYPKDPTKIFVKRVVGLPGDRVVIKNGQVNVFNKSSPNGFNPDTKYEAADTTTLIDTDETIQSGNVFVLGDNRSPGGSYDSREWGELPSSYIIGNAVLRLLPLDQVKIL